MINDLRWVWWQSLRGARRSPHSPAWVGAPAFPTAWGLRFAPTNERPRLPKNEGPNILNMLALGFNCSSKIAETDGYFERRSSKNDPFLMGHPLASAAWGCKPWIDFATFLDLADLPWKNHIEPRCLCMSQVQKSPQTQIDPENPPCF